MRGMFCLGFFSLLPWLVAAEPNAVRFVGMPAPDGLVARSDVYSDAAIEFTGSDGKRQRRQLSFRPLLRTGEIVGGEVVGGLVDVDGRPLLDNPQADVRTEPYFSGMPDGSTLLAIPGLSRDTAAVQGRPLVLLTQFESLRRNRLGRRPAGRLPMPMGLTVLDQDPDSQRLQVVSYRPLDMSSIGGLWGPCAASRTPWGSHLGGEEYEPDARSYERDPGGSAVMAMQRSYGIREKRRASAYGYGHLFEVTVDAQLRAFPRRRYALGRFSHELAVVMPDQRTVYMTDDHEHGVLFMFVAARAGDLSEGTLYAARWHQLSDRDGGRARLGWVRLGSASEAEVAGWAGALSYSGIFRQGAVRPGMQRQAAFLESRRYARLLGATAEFNKMEGAAVDVSGRQLFLAISRIGGGMLAEKGKVGDHIRLPRQSAGAIYRLSLAEKGGLDEQGKRIDSRWVARSMEGVLVGRMLSRMDRHGNRADPERIANPDNLAYSETLKTLFIGEDSALHVNNFLWSYDVEKQQLARVLSVPAGAEVAALHVRDDVDSGTTVIVGFQHAGALTAEQQRWQPRLASRAARRWQQGRQSVVGYLTGLPAKGELLRNDKKTL